MGVRETKQKRRLRYKGRSKRFRPNSCCLAGPVHFCWVESHHYLDLKVESILARHVKTNLPPPLSQSKFPSLEDLKVSSCGLCQSVKISSDIETL